MRASAVKIKSETSKATKILYTNVVRLLLFENCLHNFFTLWCFRFYFLLMMEVANTEAFQRFTVSNSTLLFLCSLIGFDYKKWQSDHLVFGLSHRLPTTHHCGGFTLSLFIAER